jgi:outer membrane lipoprotein-sorting protein
MISMNRRKLLLCTGVLLVAFPVSAADAALDQALAKMDQFAKGFKGLSAKVEIVQHMEVIHEDDAQSGVILVKRARPNDLHVKISIEKPDPKVGYADSKKVDVYYPGTGEIQEMALDRNQKSLFDMILTLGFGGTSKDLLNDYTVTLGGKETVAGEPTTRLTLIPKSKNLLEQWKQIDLWISDKSGSAVQQKFYGRSKDYQLTTYTNVQPRSDIPDSDFALPKGARKEPLNKKK